MEFIGDAISLWCFLEFSNIFKQFLLIYKGVIFIFNIIIEEAKRGHRKKEPDGDRIRGFCFVHFVFSYCFTIKLYTIF